mmetsp:Transcript_22262/g.37768  ORF Transcript_22262/g.37768 Transcript_22262/m.37768 type:complete len:206 (-) Transcript_22262:521-1138(-)
MTRRRRHRLASRARSWRDDCRMKSRLPLCLMMRMKRRVCVWLVNYKKKKKKLKNVLMKLLLQVPPLPNVYKKKNKPKLKPKLLRMQCLLKKQQMQLLLELQRRLCWPMNVRHCNASVKRWLTKRWRVVCRRRRTPKSRRSNWRAKWPKHVVLRLSVSKRGCVASKSRSNNSSPTSISVSAAWCRWQASCIRICGVRWITTRIIVW